jgi:hypothetical protein
VALKQKSVGTVGTTPTLKENSSVDLTIQISVPTVGTAKTVGTGQKVPTYELQ